MRIVSLVPGATESLFALGLGERVVAVTHECDWPPAARRLPSVTRSRLALEGLDGGGIEAAVSRAAAAGQELYEVDYAAIRRLAPDLVVAQDVCVVCAVPGAPVEERLRGIPVLRQHPHTLDDVLGDIAELAAACEVEADDLLRALRERVATAAEAAAARPTRRTVFLEWVDPPYPAGHWTPGLLELAGLDDPLARPARPSVAVTWEDVRAARPELLVIAPCGFDAARAEAEAERMAAEIAGVGAARTIVLDGSALFNRPGPRLVDSLEALVSASA